MDLFIKVNGKTTTKKDMELIFTQMVLNMKAIGSKIWQLVKEGFSILMATFLMDISKKI